MISIIVPVYNVEKYLDECIKSIVNQDYKDFELLLIDDGSKDGSLSLCREWEKKDMRIKVYSKPNSGPSETRNFGIEKATGAYLTFIDSDDYVTEDYLSYMLKLFEYSDKCSIVTCNRQIVRNGRLGQKFDYGKNQPSVLNQTEVYRRGLYTQIAHGCVARLYKKEVFSEIRFPVGVIHEDTYVLPEFINKSQIMVFGPKPCYFYRMNENSIVHSFSINRLKDLIEATMRLANMAVAHDNQLKNAAVCKIVHAKLTALSFIVPKTLDEKKFVKSLKKEILCDRKIVLRDKNALLRDKIAIVILFFGGMTLFRYSFYLYRKCVVR